MLERDSYYEMINGLGIKEEDFVEWGVKEVVELLPDVEEVEAEWEELKERICKTKDELSENLKEKINDTIKKTKMKLAEWTGIFDEIKEEGNEPRPDTTEIENSVKDLIADINKSGSKIVFNEKLKKNFSEIQKAIKKTEKKLAEWNGTLTDIEKKINDSKQVTDEIETSVKKLIDGINKSGSKIEFSAEFKYNLSKLKKEIEKTKMKTDITDIEGKFNEFKQVTTEIKKIVNKIINDIYKNGSKIEFDENFDTLTSLIKTENEKFSAIKKDLINQYENDIKNPSNWEKLRVEIYEKGQKIGFIETLKNNFTELEKKVNENGKFSGTKGIIKRYKTSIENNIKGIENPNINVEEFPQKWNELKGEWKKLKDEINLDLKDEWKKLEEKTNPDLKDELEKLHDIINFNENIYFYMGKIDKKWDDIQKEIKRNSSIDAAIENLKDEIEKNLYPQIDTTKMDTFSKSLTTNNSFTDIRKKWKALKKELNQINNSEIEKEWNELKEKIEIKINSYQDLIEIEKRLRYLMNKIDNPFFYIRSYGNRGSENTDQNGKDIQKLYKQELGLDIKFDKDGNQNPNKTMGKINQKYKKEKKLKEGDKCKVLRNCKLSHIWGFTHNVFLFNSPWNIMFTPSVIDPLTGHETHNSTLKEKFKAKMSKIIFEKYGNLIKEYNELPERRKMYDLIEKHKEDGQVYEDMLKEWDEINDKNIFENVEDDSDTDSD